MSTQTLQDQYVQVGKIRTRFWCLGDKGTSVLLLHGFGGSVENWIRNIHALAEQHRVYALDLVGSGRSDKPAAPYSLPFFAHFVYDFLDTQALDRPSLVGNSMGGGVTLQHPDRVEKLVLVSSAGLGRELNPFVRLMTLPLLGEWATRPSRKGAVRVVNSVFYNPALATEQMIDRKFELSALPGAQTAQLSIVRSLVTLGGVRSQVWRPIVEKLHCITAATLVIWGQQDRLLPVIHAQVAKDRMPNVQLHIFDPCGHVAQLERPEEFNKLVLDFLA